MICLQNNLNASLSLLLYCRDQSECLNEVQYIKNNFEYIKRHLLLRRESVFESIADDIGRLVVQY